MTERTRTTLFQQAWRTVSRHEENEQKYTCKDSGGNLTDMLAREDVYYGLQFQPNERTRIHRIIRHELLKLPPSARRTKWRSKCPLICSFPFWPRKHPKTVKGERSVQNQKTFCTSFFGGKINFVQSHLMFKSVSMKHESAIKNSKYHPFRAFPIRLRWSAIRGVIQLIF